MLFTLKRLLFWMPPLFQQKGMIMILAVKLIATEIMAGITMKTAMCFPLRNTQMIKEKKLRPDTL
ncbi:hypothetical protein SDC9_127798 [bioreactor metagenome]|uniref:Uncharacterized protein n=1 Tax=bioreactor metagenome TaxID=1076179 RepID=A0A645CV70_9ZZZZ